MDIFYYIDFFIYRVLYKLGLQSKYFSLQQINLRYIKRDSKILKSENYTYPFQLQQCNKIWMFWAQGKEKMPPIVKQCYNSIVKNKGNNEVVLLNINNYKQYVAIPPHIEQKMAKGQITITHFSDILRFALLKEYGGWWLDATIYVNKEIPHLNSLFTIKNKYSNVYVSQNNWSGFLWYIPHLHPMPKFIYDYLIHYWTKHDSLINYFLLDYVIKIFTLRNSIFSSEINNLPINNPHTYFLSSEKGEEIYSEEQWEKICETTSFFKNSWKKNYKFEKENQHTFCGKIFSGQPTI